MDKAIELFEKHSSYYSSQEKNLMDEIQFVVAVQEFIETNNFRKIKDGKDNKEI